MKKGLLLLSLLTIVGCSALQNTSTNTETKKQQVDRLLDLATKQEKEKVKKEKIEKEKLRKEQLEKERLKKESSKKTLEAPIVEVEVEGVEVVDEVIIENDGTAPSKNKKIKKVDPHENKTRGEIMVYEMNRITEEMKKLDNQIKTYVETDKNLKKEKEKFEKLKNLNASSM